MKNFVLSLAKLVSTMQLRSGKIYTVPCKMTRRALLLHLLSLMDEYDLQTEIMPQLKLHKKFFDFLNENLEEIDPPQDILRLIQIDSHSIIQTIESLINNPSTKSKDCDILFGVLDSISAFNENAEDDYIEAYIEQEESYR